MGLLKSNRFWLIALGGVLIVSVIAVLALRQGSASMALIYRDAELLESIDLASVAEPYSFKIGSDSGYNVIAVERGRVCIAYADCPDGFCVRQGWVSGGQTPIVCLPNRLIIRLEGGAAPELDAVVG